MAIKKERTAGPAVLSFFIVLIEVCYQNMV